MAEQPLALQWLCFIRDHGQDLKVTLGERALASLLPTYGQGKTITISMVSLSEITGWSRNTVKKHRDGLVARGLLEDITGDPDKQRRTYRLTVPGYVSEPGQNLSTPATPEPGQNLTTPPGQNLTTPGQNLTTPWSESDHNIKPLDREVDQAATSTSPAGPDDDAATAKGQDPSQKQDDWLDRFLADTAPEVPEDGPGGDASPADGGAGLRLWTGDDMGDNRAAMAKDLKVPVNTIGESFWTWLEDLDLDPGSWWDREAVKDAAGASLGKPNVVGYFRGALPSYVARYRAERDWRAA